MPFTDDELKNISSVTRGWKDRNPDLEEDELVSSALYVNVPGIPRPQPRPRMVRAGGKLRVVGTADKKAQLWRDAVQNALGSAARRVGWVGGKTDAYELVMVFRLENSAIGKPDLDNLVKLVMDAMQSAGLFGKGNDPDAQVTKLEAMKVQDPRQPGVTVKLSKAKHELVVAPLSGLS